MPLTLEVAQVMIQAGIALAANKGYNVSIVVVDAGGYIVAAGRMDQAQLASPDVALGKATAAALWKRPSAALASLWPAGGAVPVAMAIRTGGRFIPAQGGVPIKEGTQVIGAVGVSGAKSEQDEEVALAAVAGAPGFTS